MTELSYTTVVPDMFLKNFKEELWVDGEIVREAWCTEMDEAQPIIQDLLNNFPDYTIEQIKSGKSNMIGYANNYRPPYNNGCISWYEWEYPSASDIEKYKVVLPENCYFYRWYGKKFDLVTKQVWLKYVFRGNFPKPEMTVDSKQEFYALIADEDGNVLPHVDIYFISDYNEVKKYCTEKGLVYPAPPPEEEVKTRLWSFVYDINTLEISKVKGYRIFDVNKR